MTISLHNSYGFFDLPYPDASTRLESAVEFLNSQQAGGLGAEFILAVDTNTKRRIVQLVDIDSRQIVQELPNATIFALVNKLSGKKEFDS